MTNKASDKKQTNTNVTAQSTSDPSGSQPVSSSPKDSDSQAPLRPSSATKQAPLQPDPQNTDDGKGVAGDIQRQSSPVTSPPMQQSPAPPQRQSNSPYGGFDDWGFDDPFGDLDGGQSSGFGGGYARSPLGNSQPSSRPPAKRMTPEERVQMIDRVYNEILQRKPDTRDINYYKYSTLSEEQIRKQLIASAEHTDMIKKGREYQNVKEHAEQLESRVRMLEGQIKDHVEEFRELSNLLQEKNRHIQELRSGSAHRMPHPQNGPIRAEQAAQPVPPEETKTIPLSPETPEETQKEQPSPKDPIPLTPAQAEKIFENSPSPPQQPMPPQKQTVFTSDVTAPPPPDIQTENGIITAERNSPGRRIKRAVRELFGSFF